MKMAASPECQVSTRFNKGVVVSYAAWGGEVGSGGPGVDDHPRTRQNMRLHRSGIGFAGQGLFISLGGFVDMVRRIGEDTGISGGDGLQIGIVARLQRGVGRPEPQVAAMRGIA